MKNLFLTLLIMFSCSVGLFAEDRNMQATHPINVIPAPTSYKPMEGKFLMKGRIKLVGNIKRKDRKFIQAQLLSSFPDLVVAKEGIRTLHLRLTTERKTRNDAANDKLLQSYRLHVGEQGINLEAPSLMGLFYGLQTLRQLESQGSVACCEIKDEPRFVYRGLMLDCSRHFWPKDFVKKQLDAMAYLKLDRLHLHLTDGAGWRMQIKKYPKLTEDAAWRTESDWDKWREQGRPYAHKGDVGAYGGYYTQQDLKEIVAYAAQRHITVVPEIEMPGHSTEVTHAYPELLCEEAGKLTSDLCVGNEQTFVFLENVLKEVMKVFPSKYIHIGGDEASRKAWEKCPRCQKRMRDEHLNNVAELQSYLTHRIERFLNKHGRILIGWDEILEGKLAPNAVVMSWRGEKGGIAASKAGHDVIMSPERFCYLDHYQDVPSSQPKAFGSYVSLEQCYSFDPVCNLQGEAAERVLGLQGNLWTEQVPTMSHCEYMLYPRLFAIAENGWSKNKSAFSDFHRRALNMQDVFRTRGYNTFDLRKEIGARMESRVPVEHLAMGKKVIYHAPYSANYKAAGDSALVDGVRGGWDFHDGAWQGFISHDRLDVTIDLERLQTVKQVKASFFQSRSAVIYTPAEISVSVSEDGVNYVTVDKRQYDVNFDTDFQVKDFEWNGNTRARYIRYQAKAGAKGGWIFVDEVIVR